MGYRTIPCRAETKQEWKEFILGLGMPSVDAIDWMLSYHIKLDETPIEAGRRLRREIINAAKVVSNG